MKALEMMENRIDGNWVDYLELILNGLRDEKIFYSDISGILFDATPEMMDEVKRIEENHRSRVWHILKGRYRMSDNETFEFIDYLLVDPSDSDLGDYDNMVIDENGCCLCYTVGLYNEIGFIDLYPINGGLRRRLPGDK